MPPRWQPARAVPFGDCSTAGSFRSGATAGRARGMEPDDDPALERAGDSAACRRAGSRREQCHSAIAVRRDPSDLGLLLAALGGWSLTMIRRSNARAIQRHAAALAAGESSAIRRLQYGGILPIWGYCWPRSGDGA